MRLPAPAVVARDLFVPYRRAKRSSTRVPHRQKRDFVVEVHKPLYYHLASARAPARLGTFPRGVDLAFVAHSALPVPGRAHYRLHHARYSDLLHGLQKFLLRARKSVRGSLHSELFSRKRPDPLAVHGEIHCSRRGHHIEAPPFELHELLSGNSLDFGNYVGRVLLEHDALEGAGVEHGYDVRAVGDLHSRRVRVLVNRDNLEAESLELYCDLPPELPAAEQHRLCGIFLKNSAYVCHTFASLFLISPQPADFIPKYSSVSRILRGSSPPPPAAL